MNFLNSNLFRSILYFKRSPNPEEEQYLNLVRKVLKTGDYRLDRTAVGTRSCFGAQMEFDLSDNTIPILTTKKIAWKSIVEELLWFIQGSTDAKVLNAKGIKIWNANSSRQFLDNRCFFNREEGDIGPGYGFQWRHFGAKYIDCKTNYTNQGVDQLLQVINTIKTNPADRRMIMTAWNPLDIPITNLPPCHCFVQFHVAKDRLSCLLYQRSGDMGLGVPFNITSYALLTHMIAHVTGLKPGKFIHTLGDYHVYMNHIKPLNEQLKRVPFSFPKLYFKKTFNDITEIRINDLYVTDYLTHDSIKMDMAV